MLTCGLQNLLVYYILKETGKIQKTLKPKQTKQSEPQNPSSTISKINNLTLRSKIIEIKVSNLLEIKNKQVSSTFSTENCGVK